MQSKICSIVAREKKKEEKNMQIFENQLNLDTYLSLRESVGWKKLTVEQATFALERSLFTVCICDDKGRPVGMGRVVGDGVVIDYFQDIVVRPECQGLGVGRKIIECLLGYVKKSKLPDTEIMVCLMCAKGREQFYVKFGFIPRPTDKLGPGMIQYIYSN